MVRQLIDRMVFVQILLDHLIVDRQTKVRLLMVLVVVIKSIIQHQNHPKQVINKDSMMKNLLSQRNLVL